MGEVQDKKHVMPSVQRGERSTRTKAQEGSTRDGDLTSNVKRNDTALPIHIHDREIQTRFRRCKIREGVCSRVSSRAHAETEDKG